MHISVSARHGRGPWLLRHLMACDFSWDFSRWLRTRRRRRSTSGPVLAQELPNTDRWANRRAGCGPGQDHIWVLQRPASNTVDEIGASLTPPRSNCCIAALQSWNSTSKDICSIPGADPAKDLIGRRTSTEFMWTRMDTLDRREFADRPAYSEV